MRKISTARLNGFYPLQTALRNILQKKTHTTKRFQERNLLITNKAIYNLKDHNLLNYESYGTIELTDEGEDLAKKTIEKYDIVYVFLKDVLNIKSEEAELQAEQIKSVVNDNTINSLAKYVHKVLDMNSLDCDYDVNKERCRTCTRRKG